MSSQGLVFRWNGHSSHLNHSMAALLSSARYSDVVLCTRDRCQIQAHQVILSMFSKKFCSYFDSQKSKMVKDGKIHVKVSSEISTRALNILLELMYKGRAVVTSDVLGGVMKAGEILKVSGFYQSQNQAGAGGSTTADNTLHLMVTDTPTENKTGVIKILDKIAIQLSMKTDGLLSYGARSMLVCTPKVFFTENKTEMPGLAKIKGLLAEPVSANVLLAVATTSSPSSAATFTTTAAASRSTVTVTTTSTATLASTTTTPSEAEQPIKPVLKRSSPETTFIKMKKQKTNITTGNEVVKKFREVQDKISQPSQTLTHRSEVQIRGEQKRHMICIHNDSDIVKRYETERSKEVVIDEAYYKESLRNSPLKCILCVDTFDVPEAWLQHVQAHPRSDFGEVVNVVRCDLCQKYFLTLAEWLRHVLGSHIETESAQNKTCAYCNKTFSSGARMFIHRRSHIHEHYFVCGFCNEEFKEEINLFCHFRTAHDDILKILRKITEDQEEGQE